MLIPRTKNLVARSTNLRLKLSATTPAIRPNPTAGIVLATSIIPRCIGEPVKAKISNGLAI